MVKPKISLKAKLIMSFLVVVVIAGVVATLIGIKSISEGVTREVKSKVREDLNTARELYNQRLREIETAVSFTALRRVAVRDALLANDREMLLEALKLAREIAKLDILTITDREGVVVLRARNPLVFGDSQGDDEIISKVLEYERDFSSTQIVSRDELVKEGNDLAERAHTRYIPTPKAKPTKKTEETSGMILKAAVPIFDDNGDFIGVLYGGCLLNRKYEIVDKIKSTVYKSVVYKGKDIGTATIFQGDLRVSTNVKNTDGSRAIGTRVSGEVYDRVLGEEGIWEGRAFVVHSWYMTQYEPIISIDGKVIGILYVGILEEKYIDIKKNTLLRFLGVTIVGVVLALFASYHLASIISKPIILLNKGVEAIAEGDFDFEVNVKTRDEIGVLGDSFNRVRQHLKELYQKLQGKIEAADGDLKRVNEELVEKQEQLIQAEKLASLGRLTAGVAHEINNPLSGILTYLKLISRIAKDEDLLASRREEIRKYLATMESETARCGKIATNLLAFARQSKPEFKDSDINQVVEKSLLLLGNKLKLQNIEVEKVMSRDLPNISCDFGQIQQVIINMVMNASEAMPNGGELGIETSRSESGEFVEIAVSDTGIGIPKDQIPKLFDPFFTTKEEVKGVGLGLSVVYGIIKEHGGTVDVESGGGRGTTFKIRLPVNRTDGKGTLEGK